MIPFEQQEPGRWKALSLTVLMHVVLLAVLFVGITPHRPSKEASDLVVDLVRSRPAPPEPAPAPPPEEVKAVEPPKPAPAPKVEPRTAPPDIAVKKEPKKEPPKKPEPPKPEPKKPEPKKPEPPKPVPPEPQVKPSLNQMQELAQRELLAQRAAAEKDAAAQAARNYRRAQAETNWGDRIRTKILGNVIQPGGLRGNPVAEFVVTLLPGGEVMSVKLRRSSGNPAWDEATERAIHRSSPFPKPDDPSVFQREVNLKLCPVPDTGCR